MANPIQQAAVTRKITYLVVIAVLFTVSLYVRGKFSPPSAALSKRTIASQADKLDLRELDLGEAEVLGSAMRLGFTGMRGVVTTAMWRAAIEKQKRHEFQEMELLIRTVSRLQPHFITPWIFQGWNMSYNVSVENERLNDMYFYISRGLEFMAEGERMNTKVVAGDDGKPYKIGSPDLRYQIGFFYQNKFTASDKVTTLRSLFQLSNIPPNERNPLQFQVSPDKPIDVGEGSQFRKFCKAYPQLVRRLREKLDCQKPDMVVKFLRDNAKVPSRFKPNSELADATGQFPVLPDPFDEENRKFSPLMEISGDTFEGVLAARAWFAYAQTTLPPNPKGVDGRPIPAASVDLRDDDVFKYRVPRSPALIIFRQAPCRAQSYVAERLKKEGWFDKDTAWRPDDMKDSNSFWFKTSAVDRDEQFKSLDNAQDQWQKAYELWSEHGRATGLTLSIGDQATLRERARVVPERDEFAIMPVDQMMAQFGFTREAAEARQALLNFEKNRSMTNFEFFLEQARAEASTEAVTAGKWIDDARRFEAVGSLDEAAERYARGLAEWRKVFEMFEKYHRTDRTDTAESDAYELVMKLTELVRKERARRESQARSVADSAGTALTALVGGLGGDARPAAATPQTAFAAVSGSAVAFSVAGGSDITLALAEREALVRIVSYEPVTQEAAKRVTELGAVAVLSGLTRGVEDLDSPDQAARKYAALARASNLFDGTFDYRLYYKQRPSDVGRTDYLRWSRTNVEEDVKQRLNLLRKIPWDGPAPGDPH